MAAVPSDDAAVQQKLSAAFQVWDPSGQGVISSETFKNLLKQLDPYLNDATVGAVLGKADTNKDGLIQYDEFVSWLMQESAKEKQLKLDYRALLPERFDVDITKRYTLDKLAVGEGGYGKVFVARDNTYDNRLVAVKKVIKTNDKKITDSFKNEIKIMKQLDHPNICKVFETFEMHGAIFVVMEFLEGGEVFDRIKLHGKISELETSRVLMQVTSALLRAHSSGIAHRDIKPENIVYCSKNPQDHTVKLIDWGLGASFVGSPMFSAVGSFMYAAPEVMQLDSKNGYDCKCDLWSLGVVTYVMLCGKPPFWGTEIQHLNSAKAEKYPMSGHPWNYISDHAKSFIRSLLKASPQARPQLAEIINHPWFSIEKTEPLDIGTTVEILDNIRRFSNTSVFAATCIAAVSRQLDQNRLQHIYRLFLEMDTNRDGVLSLQEVSKIFTQSFGANTPECKDIMEVFKSLDLDGSGMIDYTEICAAGLGQRMSHQEDALWAAFKVFDTDNNGTVSFAELRKVLDSTGIKLAWTAEVCDSVAAKVLDRFDTDSDGVLSFPEFQELMRECWQERLPPDGSEDALDRRLKQNAGFTEMYGMLQQLSGPG